MVHLIRQKYPQLVDTIYNGFAARKYLDKKHVSIDECAEALKHGCQYHQGKGEYERFLKKTIKKLDHGSGSTLEGTRAYINSITTQKVQAAKQKAQKAAEAQRAAEKTRLQNQINQLRVQLRDTNNGLAGCQRTIVNLNRSIADLQNELARRDGTINQLQARVLNLTAQLVQAQQDTARMNVIALQIQNTVRQQNVEMNELQNRTRQLENARRQLQGQNNLRQANADLATTIDRDLKRLLQTANQHARS